MTRRGNATATMAAATATTTVAADNNHGNRNDHKNDGHRNDRRDDHRRNDWNGGRRTTGTETIIGSTSAATSTASMVAATTGATTTAMTTATRPAGRPPPQRLERPQRPSLRLNRGRHDSYRYNSWSRPRYSVACITARGAGTTIAGPAASACRVAYYARPYVIYDYYDCGLRQPPYGYHWVRVDGNAVLAVIATGVILDVIYNQFY